MKLHDLKPNEGSKKRRRRIARGISAGQGKTAGRGMKGQKSRAGSGGSLYRQGGNLPFYRRLPFMRGEGFTNPNRVDYIEVKVSQLDRFEAESLVTPDSLVDAGVIKNTKKPVVLLGTGDVSVALKVQVQRVTKGARQKIEAVGGSVIELVND